MKTLKAYANVKDTSHDRAVKTADEGIQQLLLQEGYRMSKNDQGSVVEFTYSGPAGPTIRTSRKFRSKGNWYAVTFDWEFDNEDEADRLLPEIKERYERARFRIALDERRLWRLSLMRCRGASCT